MLEIRYEPNFLKIINKIRDDAIKDRVKKQIIKVINRPDAGKPMWFGRKGTREVYVSPFRLSYIFIKEENTLIFLDLYHKDNQ